MQTRAIIQVLMERDRLSYAEASQTLNNLAAEMAELIVQGRFDEAEELFTSETGLEPDFIF